MGFHGCRSVRHREDIQNLLAFAKAHAASRKGGRTAFVLSSDVDFGISRMYLAWAEVENLPYELGTFRSRRAAEEWLGVASSEAP